MTNLFALAIHLGTVAAFSQDYLQSIGGYTGDSVPGQVSQASRQKISGTPMLTTNSFPFRKTDGKFWDLRPFTTIARSNLPPLLNTNWTLFKGQAVVAVIGKSLLVDGFTRSSKPIFLENYPGAKALVDDTRLPPFLAHESGTCQYQTADGGLNTVARCDFGIIPTQNEVQAYLAKLAEKQKQAELQAAEVKAQLKAQRDTEMEQRVIPWQMEQASNGSASAQCSLGLRYLEGKGVPQDEALARLWLEKSAAQNNAEAKAALAKLTNAPLPPSNLRVVPH